MLYLNNKILLLTVILSVAVLFSQENGNLPLNDLTPFQYDRMRLNAAENFFISGREAEFSEDYESASQSYIQAWSYDSTSTFLSSYISDYFLRIQQPGKAIYIMTNGQPFTELSDEILRFVGGTYIRYERYTEGLDVYREIDTLNTLDSTIYVGLLSEAGLFREAAIILQNINNPEDSLHNVKVADLYRQAGQVDSAIAIYRRLYNENTSNQVAKKGLGLSLLSANEIDEAMELLHYYLPVTGGLPDAEVIEAVARKNGEVGNFGDAVILFQFLHNGADDRSKKYYGRALAIFSLLDERYEYAIQIMKPVLAESPSDYELHFFYGSAQEMIGSSENALQSYNRAIEIFPAFEKAHHAKVVLFAKADLMDSTINAVQAYAEACPKSINAWSLYGTILTTVYEFERATFPLREAIALSGGVESSATSTIFELAMSLERSGKLPEAEDLLQIVLEREPNNSTAANYLGYMWAERGVKTRKAKKLIELALEIEPENPAFLDSYGWVLYQQGNYEDALGHLLLALESITDDYIVYYHVVMVYEKLKDSEKALDMFINANNLENPIRAEISLKIEELTELLGE